jgi:hypothetical protein
VRVFQAASTSTSSTAFRPVCALKGEFLPSILQCDVRTNLGLTTIGGAYAPNYDMSTHNLRISGPQDFHHPCSEDTENLSRQQPGSRYSIVKEGKAPFG